MTSDCERVQAQLAAFVDRELESAAHAQIAAHLDKCPDCAAAAEMQRVVKHLVQQRLHAIPAPAPLRTRVRHLLRDPEAVAGFGALLKRLFQLQPRLALATVAGIVFLSALLTYWGGQAAASLRDPIAFQSNGHLEGEIICADCELMRSTHTPIEHDESHQLVIRCSGGRLWQVVRSPKGRELLQSMSSTRQRVIADGYLFPRVGYIQVTNFRTL